METVDTSQLEAVLKKSPHLPLRGLMELNLRMYRILAAMTDEELFLACSLLRVPFPPPPFSEVRHLREMINQTIQFLTQKLPTL